MKKVLVVVLALVLMSAMGLSAQAKKPAEGLVIYAQMGGDSGAPSVLPARSGPSWPSSTGAARSTTNMPGGNRTS